MFQSNRGSSLISIGALSWEIGNKRGTSIKIKNMWSLW